MRKGSLIKYTYWGIIFCFTLLLSLLQVGCRGNGGSDEGWNDNEAESRTSDGELLKEKKVDAFSAIPIDAVAILDIHRLSDISSIVSDTSYIGYGLFDKNSQLLKFYSTLETSEVNVMNKPTLYSVQYSGADEIVLLQIIDFESDTIALQQLNKSLSSKSSIRSKYNGKDIIRLGSGLHLTFTNRFVIASSSKISVESSLRHLANGSSILNNRDFANALAQTEGNGYLYLNHKQIGKIFSGSVTRHFLRYADFVNRFATWSVLKINPRQRNFISFEGESIGNGDAINYSTLMSSLQDGESEIDEFLPASTIFAIAIKTQGAKNYTHIYRRYLDANKKLNNYLLNLERVKREGEKGAEEWFAEENFSEVVSAFCIVGGKGEWLTFTYKNSSNFFSKLLGIKKRSPEGTIEPFKYQGYFEAVLGESFSHTKEESICNMGNWSVIGPEKIVVEFQNGRANTISLKKYLSRTPASSLFSTPASVRVWVNIGEGKDTVLSVLNNYYRSRISESLKVKNFEFAYASIRAARNKTFTTLNFYASRLSSAPQMFPEGREEEQFIVDSTIKVSFEPHTIVDPISQDTFKFEQSKKYLSIFLSNKSGKTLWGIPMRDTMRSCADFVTLGSKSYIAFIMSNKLHLISVKGAFANGYPKELHNTIALGPKVLYENGEYRLLVLDSLNIISKVNLNGEKVADWKDIHAPEFTHALPTVESFYGKDYYVLRTVFRTRIYTTNGTEVEIKSKKRNIAKDSPIVESEEAGYVRVMGIDGDEFLLNLSTGKVKKL